MIILVQTRFSIDLIRISGSWSPGPALGTRFLWMRRKDYIVLGLEAVQILKIIDEQPLEHFGSAIEPKRIVLALSGNRTSGNEACLEHLNLLEST